MNYQLRSKTWKEVGEYLTKCDQIIIPVGAIEQHGPSCALCADSTIAEYIAGAVAERTHVLTGPTLPFGDSLVHLDFPGTIALKPSTLLAVIKDYVSSLHHSGFRRFLVVNGHGDNHGVILGAFSEVGSEISELRYFVQDFWDFPAVRNIMSESFGDPVGGHADAADVAIMLAIDSSLVRKDLLVKEYSPVNYWVSRDLERKLCTQSGVINSDQRLANEKIGKSILSESINEYCKLVDQLRK